jgi:hypothetical protein
MICAFMFAVKLSALRLHWFAMYYLHVALWPVPDRIESQPPQEWFLDPTGSATTEVPAAVQLGPA